MLKKILVFALSFYLILSLFSSASAKDRYIFFIEDYLYDDLYKYETIGWILNNSVKGLAIQRSGGCEFSYFYSISKKRPSNYNIKDMPLYIQNETINNITFNGFVEKDGTLYVPSKLLLSGQTFLNKNTPENSKIFIEHIKDIKILEKELQILAFNNNEIIISSWSRNHNTYEKYIMPFIYFNNKNKGIFYSETTRNKGIIDYENINSVLSGNIEKLKIVDGNINKIYNERLENLKNKRLFLSNYGLFMGILTIINSLLLIYKFKKGVVFSSLFVVITPLSILIEPLFHFDKLYFKIGLITILTVLSNMRFSKKYSKIIFILFLIIIYSDAIFFRFLLKNSLLSYEPALGARFYGIGNELLGVIVAYILIINSEFKIKKQWFVWIINAGLLLIDGGGSNFGGFLTCGIIGFTMSPFPVKMSEIALAIILILISNNHIGVFFRNLAAFNLQYIIDTIFSKLYTVKRLIHINIWTEIIVVSILIYLYNLLKGKLKFDGNTVLFVISCILVVLFNDSGIVPCAIIMMVYLNYVFYSLSMEENNGAQ